jgi:hypothetical protein
MNSLLRRMNSLSTGKKLAAQRSREFERNAAELLRKLMSGSAQMAANLQIRC